MMFGIFILISVAFTSYLLFHTYRDEELEKDDMMQAIKYGGIIQDNDIEEVLYARRTGRSMGQDPYIANAVIVRMRQGVIEKVTSQESYPGSNLSKKGKSWNNAYVCFRPIIKGSNQNPEFTELLMTANNRTSENNSNLTHIASPKGNYSFLFDKNTRLAVICTMYY
jgi:hypothetical protein